MKRSNAEVINAQEKVAAQEEQAADDEERSSVELRFGSRRFTRRELERMADNIETIDDLIDYQLAKGEDALSFVNPLSVLARGELPGETENERKKIEKKLSRADRTKRKDMIFALGDKLNVFRNYQFCIGYKDALEWVLGEGDENNGLVKMLAEQGKNPPRA